MNKRVKALDRTIKGKFLKTTANAYGQVNSKSKDYL
jgi:hypothetical protein